MKRLLIIIALAATTLTARAQQQQDDTTQVERRINIEKEYTPEIKEVKRKDIEYNIEDFRVRPSNLEYSNYVLPIIPHTPFTPLEARKQDFIKLRGAKQGFAELAFGFNFNWKAEAYYKILNTQADQLDVHLDHWGTYWGLKSDDPKVYIRTGIGLDYLHNIGQNHRLEATIDYRNRYYSYYGADSLRWNDLDSLGLNRYQCRHTLHAAFGARSTRSMHGWDYEAGVDYRMENLQYLRQTEHLIKVQGRGFRSFGIHQVELDLSLEGVAYAGLRNNNNLVVELAPYYNVNVSWMDLHAGLRMDFACMRGTVFNIMPDIRAAFHLHPMVRLNVDITGDYSQQTLARTLDICPYYIFTDTLRNAYTPADFHLGLTVTPAPGLTLNVGAQYAIRNGVLNFSNTLADSLTLTRYMRADYVRAQHLAISFAGTYVLKDRYTFHADFRWNKWFGRDSVPILYRPDFELHAGINLMPIEGLNITADYYLATGRLALDPVAGTTFRLANIHDLNIGASYTIKKIITVYANANNILSAAKSLRWQSWSGYDTMGFNMAFGLRMAF